MFVRSSDGVARLRVKLELGFLRQVLADWALVSGERRCRRWKRILDLGMRRDKRVARILAIIDLR